MLFPAYPKNSQPPIQAIKNIQNKKLPILLIHSATDQKVPVVHSYQLYQEFKQQGFENVELVILPEGRHGYILQDEKIKPLYLQAVHNFYKKYQLPYDTTWTQQEFDWTKYDPSNLQNFIKFYEKNIEKKYQKFRTNTVIMITTIFIFFVIKKIMID